MRQGIRQGVRQAIPMRDGKDGLTVVGVNRDAPPVPPAIGLAGDAAWMPLPTLAYAAGYSAGGGASAYLITDSVLKNTWWGPISIAAAGTLTVAAKMGTLTERLLFAMEAVSGGTWTLAAAYSADSTNGSDGSWSAITAPIKPSATELLGRVYLAQFTAVQASGNWVRFQLTNGDAGTRSVNFTGLFSASSTGRVPAVGCIGASITYQTVLQHRFRRRMYRDYSVMPLVLNMGISSDVTLDTLRDLDGTDNARLTQFPDVPYWLIDTGGGDVTAGKPYATDPNTATMNTNYRAIYTTISGASKIALGMNISSRDYDLNGLADGAAGQAPYNTSIVNPAIVQLAHARCVTGGRPRFDYETFTSSYLSTDYEGDGVHPNATGESRWCYWQADRLGEVWYASTVSLDGARTKMAVLGGTDEFIASCPDDIGDILINGTTEWTLLVRFKIVGSTAANPTVVCFKAGNNTATRVMHWYVSSANKCVYMVGGTGVQQTGTTTISANTWYCGVLRHKDYAGTKKFDLFINPSGSTPTKENTEAASTSQSGTLDFMLGARRAASNEDYAGINTANFQDVVLWEGTALTDAQIGLLTNGGTPLRPSELPVAASHYWLCGEDAHPWIKDRIGMAHLRAWNTEAADFATFT